MKGHSRWVMIGLSCALGCSGCARMIMPKTPDPYPEASYQPPNLQAWGFSAPAVQLEEARAKAAAAVEHVPSELRDVTMDDRENWGFGVHSDSAIASLTGAARQSYVDAAAAVFWAHLDLERAELNIEQKHDAARIAASAYQAALYTAGCDTFSDECRETEHPFKARDEVGFLVADLFTRLGNADKVQLATQVYAGSADTQYQAARLALSADAACAAAPSAKKAKDRAQAVEAANTAYRRAMDAGGAVGKVVASRTLCGAPAGNLVGGQTGGSAREAMYRPPNPAQWGLSLTPRSVQDAERVIAALEPMAPTQYLHSTPGQADTSERDMALQLGRAYLDLELALTDRARQYQVAIKALSLFVKLAGAFDVRAPWEQAETRFLAGELAWRLHDLDATTGLLPVVIGEEDVQRAGPYNGLAELLAGEVWCEKGAEYTVTANIYFHNAARISGPAAELARQHAVCGEPQMRVGELIREVQAGRRSLMHAPNAAPAAVLPSGGATPAVTSAWPSLTALDKGTRVNPRDAALIVGIERYLAVPGVPGAGVNATDWYLHLTNHEGLAPERVTLLRDEQATVEKIEAFARKAAADVKPGGTLWFVFVGHGAPAQDGRDGVLVGADAQQDAASLYARSLPMQRLSAVLQKGKQRSTVIVLDACFSGRTASGAGLIPGLQPLLAIDKTKHRPAPKTAVLSAGTHDQFAGPLPGLDRPAFSYLLLGAVRGWADANADLEVTAEEATQYARQALLATVKDRNQTPELEARDRNLVLGTEAAEKGPDLAKLVAGQ